MALDDRSDETKPPDIGDVKDDATPAIEPKNATLNIRAFFTVGPP
jgi:hypothetical protein